MARSSRRRPTGRFAGCRNGPLSTGKEKDVSPGRRLPGKGKTWVLATPPRDEASGPSRPGSGSANGCIVWVAGQRRVAALRLRWDGQWTDGRLGDFTCHCAHADTLRPRPPTSLNLSLTSGHRRPERR